MSEFGDSSLEYRQTLGCFATGVIVAVGLGAAGPVGLTINSFTSVSLDPRLVLWCLDKGSERGSVFLEIDRFGLNILAGDQQALAARFAEPGLASWPAGAERDACAGGLGLAGALAVLECRMVQRIELGDHYVLVGSVEAFRARAGDALTYFQGRYGCAPAPVRAP